MWRHISLNVLRNSGRAAQQWQRPFASVSMQLIKDLRAQTAAPISDCKKALEASEGDMDGAFKWLRERGAAKASDLEKREANEGLVCVVANDFEGAMVMVGCETDFSQRNSDFQAFVAGVGQAAFAGVPPPPGPGSHDVSIDALLRLAFTSGGGGDSQQQQEEAEEQGPGPGGAPTSPTVGDAVADIVGKIRENIAVKKACKVAVGPTSGGGGGGGIVGHYVHGALPGAPHVGTAAALVTLSTGGGGGGGGVEVSGAALEALKPLARKLAMHVVAAKPTYLDQTAIPPEVVERERAILAEQVAGTGKPPNIVAKIVEGRLNKFYGETTLLAQPHLIEPDSPPVGKVVAQAGKDLGLDLSIESFVAYRTGS